LCVFRYNVAVSETVRAVVLIVLSLPLLAGVALLSARMLGVRRSWVAVVMSTVIGWTVGFLVSLAVAGSLEDGRLLRNTLVLAFVFTMAAMVGLDLLARPGSLAQGDAAGRFVVPRPKRYVTDRLDVVRRSREIAEIAHRNGFGPQLGIRHRHERRAVLDRDPPAVRARRTLEQCGGMFVKLGQIASTRSDIVPPDFIEELSKLQSDVAPDDPEAMRAVVEAELGASVDEVFAEFEWDPIGAASIAQVYRATLRSGEPVVVKVQRAQVAEIVRRDSEVVLRLARAAENNTPLGKDYRIAALAEEFVTGVQTELDFRTEANNADGIGENMADVDGIRVPKVFEQHSTPRLLVQERFDGPQVSDSAQVDALDVDRTAMADHLLRAALKQMMTDGWFHADLHPGNVLVLGDGSLGIIDFGACGRLDPLQQGSLRQMLISVALQDAVGLRQAVSEACELPRSVEDEALERALARFLSRNVRPGQSVDAHAVADLMEMLSTFGIGVPVEFTTFGRALVVLEGTLRTIAPGYHFAEGAQKLAGEWVAASSADVTDPADADMNALLQRELIAMAPTLRDLPRRSDRVLRMIERGDVSARVSLFASADDTQFVAKMVNRAVLALIAVVLGLIAVMLVVSTGGPTFVADVSLLNFFGYLGLFGSVVLMLRVVAAIVREGLN
jgi:ubiquinone biosynthesis protein